MFTSTKLRLLFALIIGFASLPRIALATILPPNNLHLEDRLHILANMTEDEFNAIVDSVLDRYEKVVASHGAKLIRQNSWDDSTVNAYASQSGDEWTVHMFGGLARRDEVTPDGFAMVVCHELGHHLGGFPLKGDRWAATEGQSDYFATQSCAREIWHDDFNKNVTFRSEIPDHVAELCDEAWSTKEDQALCYRVSAASQSLANLLAALGSAEFPDFSTPDLNEVPTTNESHPDAQCRLDTYFMGALCGDQFNPNVIPGKNHPAGQGSEEAEIEASTASCMRAKGNSQGNRPLCWFAPQLSFLALSPEEFTVNELNGNDNGVVEPGEIFSLRYILKNKSHEGVANVSARLHSENPYVSVAQTLNNYPDLKPGDSSAGSAEFKVAVDENAPCGESVDLNFTADSDSGSMTTANRISLGAARTTTAAQNSEATTIENLAIVFSQIEVLSDVNVSTALISVNIDHKYTSDVILSLVDPNGATHSITRLPFEASNHIEATYEVPLEHINSAGDWQLKIEDTYRIDDGVLNSWSIGFRHFECE